MRRKHGSKDEQAAECQRITRLTAFVSHLSDLHAEKINALLYVCAGTFCSPLTQQSDSV